MGPREAAARRLGVEVIGFLDFHSFSAWINLAIFAVAGAIVWFAGTRLSRYVNEISERTGVGKAFLGALLLGGITSLPEVATTITASVTGDPVLAVNNIFGSIAMNVLLLAIVADLVDGGKALTSLVQEPTLIMQAALSILVIAVAAAAAMITGFAVWGVGVGSLVLFVVAVVAFYLTHRLQDIRRWIPAEERPDKDDPRGKTRDQERTSLDHSFDRFSESLARTRAPEKYGRRPKTDVHPAEHHDSTGRTNEHKGERGAAEQSDGAHKRQQVKQLSTQRLVLYTVVTAVAILGAGYFLSRTGSAIADQTGLGSGMVGFILVAFGTSLPEISTLISSVRMGQFSLVFSEIFGTNIFNSTIILITDLVYGGGPILDQVGRFSQFAALLGIMLTAVYVVGLVTRSRDTSVGRLGKDSLAVIGLYAAGAVVLYLLR